nr:MAG TPA: tail tape measure protein [Caudoviricetes sp.]
MEPVRLEILLDDKTLKGMRSVEGNLGSMGQYTEAVIANLESQLKSLQKQFKQAMSTGVNTDAQMADIQALQGVIGQLKAELEELKKIGKGKLLKLDISPYITAEVQALSSAEQKMKVIIANMQQDLDALRQKSLEATVTGVVNEQDQTKIKTLEAGIRSLTAELDKYTASKNRSNETPVIQDDPAPRLNNVKMSMQQIARELPAMAMGPQMFFLAISNNIPMFTDALASARKEYEALTAAGKKATPVWKQVLSSLFSWQTAMATAITLTVVYGKEIGNFFSQLVKGRKTLTDLADAQVKVNESMDAADLSKKIITIRSLQDRWNDLGDNLKEKKKFIKDNADEFKKLDVAVNNVNDAENLLVDNTAAFIEAMTLRAEAAAAFKLASEEAEKALKAQIEIDKRKEKGPNLKDKAISFLLFDPQWVPGSLSQKKDQSRAETVWEAGIKNQEVIKKTAEEDAETYTSIYNKKLIEAAKKLKAAGIDEYEKPDTGKSARDYQDELADARIKAQQKLEAARIAVMKDGIEKRQKLAKQELEESLAQINKEERDTLKKMEEAEKKGVKITPEEKKAVKTNAQQQRLVAYQQYAMELYAVDKEFQEKDLKSWIEYNKEYGTYQQKRAAIMKEYTLKSSQKGLNEDDKKLLAKQRDEALSALDFTELKNVINWDVVFGNLDRVTKQELQKVKKQIIAFRNSPEFKKNATPEQIKVIEEAIGKIDEEVINKGGLFGNLTESIREYSQAVGELTEAQKAYDEAVKKYGEDSAEAETARKNKNKAEAKVRNTEGNLETSKDKTVKNLTAVADAMNQLGDANLSLTSFGSAVGSLVDVLSESGSKIGGIIAAVLAIFDQISEKGLVNFAGGIVKSLGNAAAKMWGGFANVLTLGKFNIGGADYSDYNEMVDKYNRLNEIWDELIDKKSEYIEMSYGSEAAKVGQEALDLAQKSLESYKRLGKERLNSGASTGSSSIGVRIRKSMSQYEWDQWDEFARSIGMDPNDIGYRMNEIFSLTADQLERLKEMAPDFWAKLTADDSVKEYLDAIIEGGERIEEIQQQIQEQLTQVSFDSMRDAFYDTLLDMESDSQDFADDFSAYLQKAILMTNLTDAYDKRLQEWYDKFANYNKEGGIDTDEYKDLQEEWNKIVEDALAERDALKDIFGWTSSSSSTQSGRAGTITSMTEETAGRLEGIGNAMLDHVINIDNLISSTLEMMATAISRIAENSEYLKLLETIDENIMDLRRSGVKMKG